ncbi:GNAT family N-acetyltransferase [Streptomyces sp. NPDC093510]|uniref:GNAT family N-acetyltransferase n=1 Tax=Streptomyces sp. NPDC093510 TaxID=3155199 RepID=UPI003430BE1E
MDITIRRAHPEEYAALGDLTAQAYLDDGHLDYGAEDRYLPVLRDVAGRAAHAEILVAVADQPVGGAADGLLGGVTFVPAGGPMADIARDGETEIRMLAVAHAARGRGVGEILVRACVQRSRDAGRDRLVLSSSPSMRTAHRLYERLGFVRTPERDWCPLPDLPLRTYALTL